MPGIYFDQFLTFAGIGQLADSVAAPSYQRPNDITTTNSSVINKAIVAIAPATPTAGDLNTTILAAQSRSQDSVNQFGENSTGIIVTLLETLDDAGDLSSYLIQTVPRFWFGNIKIIMNGLTDEQRTTITNLDIGSQISVTKTFPKSTPSTVTQLMELEGISHDISPDRHIVTLYTNPARIYTYFIVGTDVLDNQAKGLG
jgi:Flp pilus assembly secretin CpaC